MSKNRRRNPNILDTYKTYDPLLGHAKHNNAIPGFDVWPENMSMLDAKLKVMVLGGSTSTWPGCRWSQDLGGILTEKGWAVMVFNGGMAGYSSSQELTKLLRDAPALRPDIIVVLSGVNDVGFIHVLPQTPLVHRYQLTVSRYLLDHTDAYENFELGVPSQQEPHEHWLRNTRIMRAIATELEISILTSLQPTMVYGGYAPNEEERKMMEPYVQRGDVCGRPALHRGGAPLFRHCSRGDCRRPRALFACGRYHPTVQRRVGALPGLPSPES